MIVAAEEHYLRDKFGTAFDAYCHDVPRWLPRLDAARHLLTGSTFHWRRVIAKEFGTPTAWIGVLCGITLYRLWEGGLWYSRPEAVHAIMAVIVAMLMFWATARVLKKSHVLIAD
jgi:protein-S-isoprenylcysteine O-methyltransferase Ste14